MPGNLYKRPMFRKGGSAEGGITSGLSTPKRGIVDGPGSYAGVDMNLNVEQALKNASLGDLKTMADQMYSSNVGTARPKRRFNDFLIDFGLDIASRPAEGNIFQTAAMSAKDPFKRFQDARSQEELLMETQNEKLEDRRSDMFKTLIEGQSDILAEKSGNTSYKDLEIARKLRSIMPRFVELKAKRENNTLEEGEDLELKMLQEDYNRFSAKNLEDDLLMEIYANSLGDRAIPNREEELFNED